MLTNVIPSYLYLQYSDDEDLQAFVRAYNNLAQKYIDFFNTVILPVYTSDEINGDLLDWVSMGVYGIMRPTIGSFFINPFLGPFNTAMFNTMPFNGYSDITPVTLSDDVFKRIITWHFYKGDGKVFNIIWLKRRIERFLFGKNGTDFNGATYRISVSFIDVRTVIIRIINVIIRATSGALFNRFGFNTTKLGAFGFSAQLLPKIQMADVLKVAIDAKVLELPFQFDYIVLN